MSGRKHPDDGDPVASDEQVLDHELVAMLDEMLTPPERERILSRAQEQLKSLLRGLHSSWGRADLATLAREAHQLAGLAGSVGCVRVTELARDIETACRRARSGDIPERLGTLTQALPPALDALELWRTRAAAV